MAFRFLIAAIFTFSILQASAEDTPRLELERLPNGAAELHLVNGRYPFSFPDDLESRRVAYQKTMEYFPEDNDTQFVATIEIAMIDRAEGKASAAEERARAALAKYGGHVNPGYAMWGQYQLALAVAAELRRPEAIKILERLENTPNIPPDLRGWCRYSTASLLEKTAPAEAIALLTQNCAEDAEAQPASFGMVAKLLAQAGRVKDLQLSLKILFAQKSKRLDEALDYLGWTTENVFPPRQDQLIKLLRDTAAGTPAEQTVSAKLEELQGQSQALHTYMALQQELKSFLASSGSTAFEGEALPVTVKTSADYAIFALNSQQTDDQLAGWIGFLTRFQPGPDYSRGFYEVCCAILYQMGAYGKTPYPALFDECASLLERLAPDDFYYGSAPSLREEYLRAGGDAAGARKAIEAGLAGNLPEKWHADAEFRLGLLLEKSGDYAAALEHYKAAEPTSAAGLSRRSASRPAFLNLELGNRAEALRILKKLAALPNPGVSTETYLGEDVVRMASNGGAEKYWDAAAAWWPAWQTLEKNLGLEPKKVLVVSPEDLWDIKMRQAVENRDRAKFLALIQMLVHQARWDPRAAFSLCSQARGNIYSVLPEESTEIDQFLISVLEHSETSDTAIGRSAIGTRILLLLNLGQNGKALQASIDYLKKNSKIPGTDTEDILRFRCLAATNLDDEAAIKAAVPGLEKLIASRQPLAARANDIEVLENGYERIKDTDHELKLLGWAVDDHDVRNSPTAYPHLKARYDYLRQSKSTVLPANPGFTHGAADFLHPNENEIGEFDAALADWLAQHKPAWYDFAEPKDLSDPRMMDVEGAVTERTAGKETWQVPPAERVKVCFLAASDTAQALSFRTRTFARGFHYLLQLCGHEAELRSLTQSVIENKSFPAEARRQCAATALEMTALNGHKPDAEYIAGVPGLGGAIFGGATTQPLLLTRAGADTASAAEMEKNCSAVLAQPLNSTTAHIAESYILALQQLGEWDRAGKLITKIGQCATDLRYTEAPGAIQLRLQKAIDDAKADGAVNRAFQAVILAHYDPKPAAQPPIFYPALRDGSGEELASLNNDDLSKLLIYRIASRQNFGDRIRTWFRLIRILSLSPGTLPIAHELAKAALENAGSDHDRSMIVSHLFESTDAGDPAQAAWLTALLDPWRADASRPATYSNIIIGDAGLALRRGQPVDLDSIAPPRFKPAVLRMKMQADLSAHNLDALKAGLEAMEPGQMVDPQNLEVTIPALDALSMTDQATLIRQAARHQLYLDILASWSHADASDLASISSLAKAIGDPLPPAYLSAMEKVANGRVKDKTQVNAN